MFQHHGAVCRHSITLNCCMFRHHSAVFTHIGAIYTDSITLTTAISIHLFHHKKKKNAKIILYVTQLYFYTNFIVV
jgi:hypothetical protein